MANFFKYTSAAIKQCYRKPKQTAKIFRAEYIIVFISMGRAKRINLSLTIVTYLDDR